MLTFELNQSAQSIEIHGDPTGLQELIRELDELVDSASDHTHVMTADWGGSGLSIERQGAQNELVHHVKIFCWR